MFYYPQNILLFTSFIPAGSVDETLIGQWAVLTFYLEQLKSTNINTHPPDELWTHCWVNLLLNVIISLVNYHQWHRFHLDDQIPCFWYILCKCCTSFCTCRNHGNHILSFQCYHSWCKLLIFFNVLPPRVTNCVTTGGKLLPLSLIKRYHTCPPIRTTCLSPKKGNLFVPQKGQSICPPIRATYLSPNKGYLFVPQ